ncbi:MAG: hypothetical protein KDA24_11665 [Deltaproteobacteria bacterium]|nr:hypothetical protein [Deltaproteobacteria bacterium]
MTHRPQGRPATATALSALVLGAALAGCSGREFVVPVSFVVPQGHDSFAELDFLALAATYGDGRAYDFFIEAPSSGTEWNIPQMPAGAAVTLSFEGLVSDGLGADGQVVAASGSAGPLAFDPETEASARVLFTRRGRTGTLPGGPSGGTFEPLLVELGDGRVLALGGADGHTDREPVGNDGAWLFGVDGTTDAFGFVDADRMRGPRMDHAALRIEGSGTDYDGKVVVVGSLGLVEGRGGVVVVDLDEDTLDEARDAGIPEVFDPATGTWEDLADDDVMRLNAARGHHGLGQVGDGVFIIGGIVFDDDLGLRATAEVQRVDLGGADTEPVAAMGETRWRHSVTPVGSDRLLVVGGAALPTAQTTFPETASVEIYDAGDNEWTDLEDLEPARSDHVALALEDGRVMVVAGITETDTLALADTWFIEPDEGTWVQGPDLGTARAKASGRVLPDGRVVVCGGETPAFESITTCEVWTAGGVDGLGAWGPAPDPTEAFTPRSGARSALLGSGEVLVVGGQSGPDALVSDVVVYRP